MHAQSNHEDEGGDVALAVFVIMMFIGCLNINLFFFYWVGFEVCIWIRDYRGLLVEGTVNPSIVSRLLCISVFKIKGRTFPAFSRLGYCS